MTRRRPARVSTTLPSIRAHIKDIKVGFAPADFSDRRRPRCARRLREGSRNHPIAWAFNWSRPSCRLPLRPVLGTIISAEGSAVFEPLITSGKVDELADPHQIAGLKAGLEIPAKDYLKAMRIRSLIQEAFRDLLSTVDVLIAPTRFGPAPKVTEPLDRSATSRPTPSAPGLRALIPAGNLAGLPALSIPCGFANGLPMGLQLVGSPFSENMLLAIGKTFQERTDWHKRRPPIQ